MSRNSLSNIWNLGLKEFRSLSRDWVMLFLIGWVFTFGVYISAKNQPDTLHKATIAIIDEDKSQLSMRFISAFYGPHFKKPDIITQHDTDPEMDRGHYIFVLNIPPSYQRDVLAGKNPALQVNVDATQMSQAFIGAGYIRTIINGELSEFVRRYRSLEEGPVKLEVRMRFNPNLMQVWYMSVMEVMNNITLLSIMLTGAALIREREHGTIEHLLVMPLSPFELMAAKVWSMGCVVLMATIFSLYVMVRLILQVEIAGSIPLFLCGTLVYLFATTSMGIFLGTVARSMPQMGLLTILVLLPILILSGSVTPRESMPVYIQNLMSLMPTTHFVALAQAILYRGAGIDIVWPRFATIILIGLVFFGAAHARFRKAIAQMQT
ncbi:ABC transporter permease [Desulfobacterium sp. N47]|uniref:Inner membrane transport permease yhhJ n=1 Tax=uncultured Desulfobacterium sp. TaxID=201089 RepID=E1YLQ0_9BACT|nr:Inner membrane transport permease yhhJ [uncultured Desulfobacterium sp.]